MAKTGSFEHDTGAADNTRVALHFANAAKRVTMQPHVNEVVNQKALLRKLRDEVLLLRKQLVSPRISAVIGVGVKEPDWLMLLTACACEQLACLFDGSDWSE